MSRTKDIVFIFNGGEPFSQRRPVAEDFNLQAYNANRAKLNYNRELLQESRGTGGKIDEEVNALMSRIRIWTKDALATVGQVCLLGRSEGCALALGLAAELNAKGVVDLTFVGVSDVPLWDNGRDPSVQGVGNFKPMNQPNWSGAVASPRTRLGAFFSEGPVPDGAIPFVKLDTEIKAKMKINLYQIQGNHMKYSSSAKRWMWWSDLSLGEVHGELVQGGWFNRQRPARKSSFDNDLDLHVNLNFGEHWKAMCNEAAAAFALLPQTPLP